MDMKNDGRIKNTKKIQKKKQFKKSLDTM